MPDESPEGWAEASLREVLAVLESGSRPRGGVRGIRDGIPSLGGEHLTAVGGFNLASTKYVPQGFYAAMNRGHVSRGDVLVVKDGATTGKVSLVREDFPFDKAVVNEHVFICRPASGVHHAFLFWFLWSSEGQRRILENFQGSAQGGINQSFADRTTMPIAPFSEQQRIVTAIETLMARVDAARRRLGRVPAILKWFRQAVMAAACDGRLTRSWRDGNPTRTGDALLDLIKHERAQVGSRRGRATEAVTLHEHRAWEVPSTWAWVSVTDLLHYARSAAYGVLQPGAHVTDGVPLIRVGDVSKGTVDGSALKRIAPSIDVRYPRTKLAGHEVVVTLVGTIGRVGVVPAYLAGANVARAIAVLPLCPHVVPEYVRYCLEHPVKNAELVDLAREVARKTLNLGLLKAVRIPLPPLEEQQGIATRANALFALADRVERNVDRAVARAERLPDAVLRRAFSGQLVTPEAELAKAEGRVYEPADALLQRIARSPERNGALPTARSLPRQRAGT